MERLIVKNFGPLKDIDIELHEINLFIGENGSGKSILAKLVTIITDIQNFKDETFLTKINNFNINYITEKTVIQLFDNNSKNNLIQIINKKVTLNKKIKELITNLKKKDEIMKNFLLKAQEVKKILNEKEVEDTVKELLHRDLDLRKILTSQYIPAERNLISLFSKSLSSLLVADIPLPKFLLHFSSEFEKAGNELKELEFLNVKYLNGDGLDRHKVYFNNEDYLPLEHSSSGIQSALPLYLTLKYFANRHSSIIIEEPEQNLFPKAQAETIKYIVEQISDNNTVFMMTHSPYVLSTLNNLIYAHIVAELGDIEKEQVQELIDEKQWINPDDFSAYYLENGIARSIKSDIGLISNNEIDDISEEMGEEFDELLEIYRASKND